MASVQDKEAMIRRPLLDRRRGVCEGLASRILSGLEGNPEDQSQTDVEDAEIEISEMCVFLVAEDFPVPVHQSRAHNLCRSAQDALQLTSYDHLYLHPN